MPFDLGLGSVLWMSAVILVAGFVRGYSGFGYSAIVIAASSVVMSPLHFVAVVVILAPSRKTSIEVPVAPLHLRST